MRLSLPARHSFLSPPTCARIVTFVEVQASGRSRRMRMVLRLTHEFRFFVQVSQLPSTFRLHTMKNTEVLALVYKTTVTLNWVSGYCHGVPSTEQEELAFATTMSFQALLRKDSASQT